MERKDDRLNETRINNNGERMTIVRYGGKNDIDVQFQDGTIVEHRKYCAFKIGNVKNPMTPIGKQSGPGFNDNAMTIFNKFFSDIISHSSNRLLYIIL